MAVVSAAAAAARERLPAAAASGPGRGVRRRLGLGGAAATRAAGRPRRAGRAVPPDHRPGAGQGGGGHRVLPVAAAGRAERGGRRPGPVRRQPGGIPRLRGPAGPGLAGHHDHVVHPRHQAPGGRPGPAGRARRDGRTTGRTRSPTGTAWPLAHRWRGGPGHRAARSPTWSTCCGRPWPAPGRSATNGCAPTCARPCTRPRRGPRGRCLTRDTRRRCSALADAVLADPELVGRHRRVRGQDRAGRPGELARRQARPAHHARRARRLPGLRAGRLSPWSTRTTAGRSTTSARAGGCWPQCRTRPGGRRPGRREAAGHHPGAAAAARSPRLVRRQLHAAGRRRPGGRARGRVPRGDHAVTVVTRLPGRPAAARRLGRHRPAAAASCTGGTC